MITNQLINPASIVIIGASDGTKDAGGVTLHNIVENGYKGKLLIVSSSLSKFKDIPCYRSVDDIPSVECAIISTPNSFSVETIDTLANKKGCRAIIVNFQSPRKDDPNVIRDEKKIREICAKTGTALVGTKSIGVITPYYAGVCTVPVPKTTKKGGVTLILGSGSTSTFIIETAMQYGMKFNSVFAAGHALCDGVAEILEYLDNNYVEGKSASVIMLYIEHIANPAKFMKHASSLTAKGVKMAALKTGWSEVGNRIVFSHIKNVAPPDKSIEALFRKVGIVRCFSRTQLVSISAIMQFPQMNGKRIGILTHAGGPAVMLADTLSTYGLEVPRIDVENTRKLEKKLSNYFTLSNPIDIFTSGKAEDVGIALDFLENDCPEIDGIVIVFGCLGFGSIKPVCDIVLKKSAVFKKPIFPVFPSLVNSIKEINDFHDKGGISFPDEALFGHDLAKLYEQTFSVSDHAQPPVDTYKVRKIIDNNEKGYLEPEQMEFLFESAGIPVVKQEFAYPVIGGDKESSHADAIRAARSVGYPLVMKVVGTMHKTEIRGISLNVKDDELMLQEFDRLMNIPQTTGIAFQQMLSGMEMTISVKKEPSFGHIITLGFGGILKDSFSDVSTGIAPISIPEADEMIRGLSGYKVLEGRRGHEGVNHLLLNEVIRRVSALCSVAPEIVEMEINPMFVNQKQILASEVRIRIEK